MQSYIGLITQQHAKVNYKTWRHVPKEVKYLIWESVNLLYKVLESWRSGFLESASTKWHVWKSRLYNEFIVPNKDDPTKLHTPPPDSGILAVDWDQFVISHMSNEFKKLSDEQKERRNKHIYPHRLSHKGYADLTESMKDKLHGDNEIDRAIMWKKTQVMKEMETMDDNLKMTINRIEKGVFKSEGRYDDLLTCALEKPEHSRRVRGIGAYGKPVALTMRSTKTIVGYGTVIGVYTLLHGAPMPKSCVCVAIGEAVGENAPLPFPIPYVSYNIGSVIGSHVAWPAYLVVVREKTPTKNMVEKKVVRERMVKNYASLPSTLKALYCYSGKSIKDRRGIPFSLDADVLGSECEISIHFEDVVPFCNLEQISGASIIVYIRHLYTKLKEENTNDRFLFVNPFAISYAPKVQRDERACMLVERLESTPSNQLVFVPCNMGTMNMFNAKLGRKGKKTSNWEVIKGPIQPNSKLCGYYVMRFMNDIVKGFDDTISITSLLTKRSIPK
ncbi:hypothetical protein C2S52_006155 [Perilla frutescens var. hirtella]|nr:hypothetical protein C2S52_006155 [Perilla frutescens var. hirtella]